MLPESICMDATLYRYKMYIVDKEVDWYIEAFENVLLKTGEG